MCFSAEASFVSAGLVGGIGVLTLAKVRASRELLLGALPLMFALHELDEGAVWLSLEGKLGPVWQNWSVAVYIVFAQALLTAIAPWSIWLIEPRTRHKRLLLPILIFGTALCGFALWQLYSHPTEAMIRGHGIEYITPLNELWWFSVLYVIATCAPLFFSSYRWLIVFGVLNLAALLITLLFKSLFLTSVWCLFAALLSVLVYLHFRRVRQII